MNCLICKKQDGADAPGVCPQCFADAKLGRLVRKAADDDRGVEFWRFRGRVVARAGMGRAGGDTPEEALEKAMEGGK